MATTSSATTQQIQKVSTTVPRIEGLESIIEDHPFVNIRPLLYPSDIKAYHSLWKQPLIHLDQDNYDTDPHTDLSKTQDKLLRITKAQPSYGIHYGIFNKKDDIEGELIGEGGVKISESSWPSIYYSFRKGSETSRWINPFIFMLSRHWWSLPRKEKEITVYSFSIPHDFLGIPRPFELLCADTRSDDQENAKHLEESSFNPCGTLPNGHTYWRHSLKVTVSTTQPILENLSTPIQPSERLIYRTLKTPLDVEPLYSIRKQSEAMKLLGHHFPDQNSDRTRKVLLAEQSDLEKVQYGIFLKEKDGREGELIGYGGVNAFKGTWPSLFYVFKKEHWNYGYGTEFVKAFMIFWWSLPRKDVQLRVLYSYIDFREKPKVTELIVADTNKYNERSIKVLQKAGFVETEAYARADTIYWRYPPLQI